MDTYSGKVVVCSESLLCPSASSTPFWLLTISRLQGWSRRMRGRGREGFTGLCHFSVALEPTDYGGRWLGESSVLAPLCVLSVGTDCPFLLVRPLLLGPCSDHILLSTQAALLVGSLLQWLKPIATFGTHAGGPHLVLTGPLQAALLAMLRAYPASFYLERVRHPASPKCQRTLTSPHNVIHLKDLLSPYHLPSTVQSTQITAMSKTTACPQGIYILE